MKEIYTKITKIYKNGKNEQKMGKETNLHNN